LLAINTEFGVSERLLTES